MQPNHENSKLAAKGCGKAAPWKSPKNGLSPLAWKSAYPADFHFPHSLGYYRKSKDGVLYQMRMKGKNAEGPLSRYLFYDKKGTFLMS